jgi:hypothetical protein
VSLGVLLALLLGTVVPALTAIFTRLHASDRTKALLQGMLSAVAGALSGALLAPPPDVAHWLQIVECMVLSWVAAGAAFIAGWKPTGASDALAYRTARFGIGGVASPSADDAEEGG